MDASGNVHVVGSFYDMVDFDPGAGTANLTASDYDAFVAKRTFSDDNVVVLSGGDYTAPTISSATPTDNATGVDPTADLSVTFDENVAKGTGNISIYDSSDTLFEAIDFTLRITGNWI